MINISTDISAIPAKEILNLYVLTNNGLADREDVIERLFPANVKALFAIQENQLVGILRYFTDNYTCVWVAEAIVMPSSRSSKTLDVLLESLIAAEANMTIYSEVFSEQLSNFEKYGITRKSKLHAVARRATPMNIHH